jgi:hypothetical protein
MRVSCFDVESRMSVVMQEKVKGFHGNAMFYNGVGWVDKPNVSDGGLWICWVCNPTYPLTAFVYIDDCAAAFILTFTQADAYGAK